MWDNTGDNTCDTTHVRRHMWDNTCETTQVTTHVIQHLWVNIGETTQVTTQVIQHMRQHKWQRMRDHTGETRQVATQVRRHRWDRPVELATAQSDVLDSMWLHELLLTIPSRANPVLKSTGWHASRWYYINSTLKTSRQAVIWRVNTKCSSYHNRPSLPGFSSSTKLYLVQVSGGSWSVQTKM